MPTATPRRGDSSSTAPRLVVTIGFAAVALFIAGEPYLIPWATEGMQVFQGAIVFLFWLLLMFGSTRTN